MKHPFLQILLCLFASNCTWNYQDIEIYGHVKDEHGRGIPGAIVNIKCWVYSTKTWDSFSIDKQVQSDKNGTFKTEFSEGELLEFRVEAPGYLSNYQAEKIKKSRVNYTFSLKKR